MLYRDPLGERRWEGPVELLTWGRGYACISVPIGPLWLPTERVKPYQRRLTSPLWIAQTERVRRLKDLTQMTMTKRPCRIRAHCQNWGKQATRTTPPPEPKGITWGDLKTLNSKTEEVMEDVGVQETPEN